MNCESLAQDLALAAAGCLDSARHALIIEHCRHCAPCEQRFHELQRVAQAHLAAAHELRAVPFRPQQILPEHHVPHRAFGTILARFQRWVLPLSATIALGLLVWFRPPPALSPTPGPAAPAPALPVVVRPTAPVAPSLAAYRRTLNEPEEASLNALLAQHERHLLPPTPDLELRSPWRDL